MEATSLNVHHGSYLMELKPWTSPHVNYTIEVTSWNLHHRSYLMERTPWKLPHGITPWKLPRGTYSMEVT